MAVREGQDRRVGGHPEKLLTLEEAARRLQCPADDVEALVRAGKLPSFRLGGNLLRFRPQDVEAARPQVANPRPPPAPPGRKPSSWDRLADFVYFNDFYLVILLVILTLLALIIAL